MKQILTVLSISAIILLGMVSALTNAGGSPGAKTGSTADGSNCTQCHAGTAQTVTSWISSDIPASGYIAGQTYTITLIGTHTGVARFGFEITAEDASNNKVGTFIITNAGQTKLVNSNNAVCHTGNGLTPTNDSKAWSFDWTAPSVGTGDITFYAALNAADGNMTTSGDVIYLTSQTITENNSVSIKQNSTTKEQINLYPSVVDNNLNLQWENLDVKQVLIYSITGQQLMQYDIENGSNSIKLDVSSLSKGTYLCYFEVNGEAVVKRFVKK